MDRLNDLELLDKFCETCLDFVSPMILRDIEDRGLLWVVNRGLPNNVQEAKAVVRARLAKVGRTFGDPEIDHIANEIKRIEFLRDKLTQMNMADANKVIPILKEMLDRSDFILSYYKS